MTFDHNCIALSTCGWHEIVLMWLIGGFFLGYIVGSAIITLLIISTIIKS